MTQLHTNGAPVKNKRNAIKPVGLPCPNSSASFWHSEPNAFLLGHKTTAELPTQADVVIVGSGITGASVARYLCDDPRSKDMSILMVDAREVCWGATGRNGGHCQPLLFDNTPDVAAFELKNVAAVKSYIEEHDVPCEWRSVTGCRTFWDQKHFDDAKRVIKDLFAVEPKMADLLTVTNDPEDFKEHYVKPAVAGMTLTKGAGQLWPYKYVTFIVEKLVKEKKLNVQTNTPVTKIERGGDTHIVQTSRGQVKTKHVVLATNGYTSRLLDDFASLIVPIRCEMSALHPPTMFRLPNSYGMVGYQGGHPEHDDYLIQRPFIDGKGGHLMFGGGRKFAMYPTVGEWEDDIVDPGEADYLRRELPAMLELGDDQELKASHQWTGIKGYSRDNLPWVGRVEDGLWLCAGYSGHGMPNATLCAKAVVEMMLGEHEEVGARLVRDGDLPKAYLLTKERIEAAKKMLTVVEQDGLA